MNGKPHRLITEEEHELDRAIGARLRAARQQAGMSQEGLGKAVGITFQQMQKYEKGTNRIGGSRLVQLSTALGVPPATLLGDGSETPPAPLLSAQEADLLTAFRRLPSRQQQAIRTIIHSMLED